MNKHWYYVIPFIAFPVTSELCCFINDMKIVEMNFCILIAVLFLVATIIGNLSPTNKMFDYAIPVVSLIAYNCYRFVCGFLSKTDLETRFSIFEAIEWIFVDTSLLISAVITTVTFLASFKFIRVTRITKK